MPRLSKIGAAALAAFGWTGLSSVSASYLVVAGGGGGGQTVGEGGGGGGAGGFRTGTSSLNPTLSYTITVGAGGAKGTISPNNNGSSGSDSVFNTITSSGGGKQATAGGSGGGGTSTNSNQGAGNTPSTSPSQGNSGGGGNGGWFNGGGGGGAGSAGSISTSTLGGAGGSGSASSISGSSVTYAGGGGGGGYTYNGGAGGSGGGGNGGTVPGAGQAGGTNLGGGGGAGSMNPGTNQDGGNGGSGVVIISYPAPQQFGGGVVTTSGSNVIHTFNTSGTLSPLSSLTASYLIVAGGGAGGVNQGGGGGAGGLLSGSGLTIDTNSNYVVVVGAGATQTGVNSTTANGSNSSFSMVSTVALGGGGAGGYTTAGASGGSGGGGGGANGSPSNYAGGSGTSGQGFAGGTGTAVGVYTAGGGGGSSAVGANSTVSVGGNGGAGTASSISGTSVTYAGGGGGGVYAPAGQTPGSGGAGGGGAGGGTTGAVAGTNGTAGLGGGGGGGAGSGGLGGNGGSGVVIISYAGATQQMAGGTVTITGGNVIHTFTSSGYLTPIKYVNNSLRFRSSASAYLSRTPATAGNRKTWTWSAWVKRGALSRQMLFCTPDSNNPSITIEFQNETFWVQDFDGSANQIYLTSTAVLRDPSAWYHLVFAIDTTQATASNRAKMYINGVQVTSFVNSIYPTQNYDGAMNRAVDTRLGAQANRASSYFDGYLTEINFIDGQALTPNSFGTFNSYGVWQPITYGGSYGTNGFYLPFTNNTNTTTIGYDFSPNGNNWTPNNISTSTGVTYDSMTDVPTLTSATAANYCVVDVLSPIGSASALSTVASANLQLTHSGSTYSQRFGNMVVSSGKWYFEFTLTNIGYPSLSVGVSKLSTYPTYNGAGGQATSCAAVGYFTGTSLSVCTEAGGTGAGSISSQTWSNGDIIMVAFSIDTGKIWWGKNGTWYSSGNPAADTNNITTITSGAQYRPWVVLYGTTTDTSLNFGQRPFSYTPPTGFVALNTYNL